MPITLGAASCLALLTGALTAVSTPAASGAEPFCTVPAGSGLVVNQWIGPAEPGDVGDWVQNSNWSLGTPDNASTNELVCIDTDGIVRMTAGFGVQANVGALDLSGSSSLEILRGNKLFVEAPQDEAGSIARQGSTILIAAAYFGGTGAFQLDGDMVWRSQNDGAASFTSRGPCMPAPCSLTRLPVGADRGVLRVGTTGTLALDGRGVNLQDEYQLDVHGEMVFEANTSSFVAADHGTSLTLQPSGVLLIQNDGGWVEGSDPYGLPFSQIVNNGSITKSYPGGGGANGISALTARFPVGTGAISVESGSVSLPNGVAHSQAVEVAAGRTYGSGRCDPSINIATQGYSCKPIAFPGDRQISSVRVPSQDPGGAKLKIAEVTRTIPGFGMAFKLDEAGLSATRRNPAIVRLRYDASLVGSRTPSDVKILHQHAAQPWRILPTCLSLGRIPADAVACVDRRPTQSRIVAGGDLEMVVRTTQFSRWVAR